MLGVIKKEGGNKNKVFSCLRTGDGKPVEKTFQILNEPLEVLADFKSGVKKMGDDMQKKWQCWCSKETGDIVTGTYSEEISPLVEDEEEDEDQSM